MAVVFITGSTDGLGRAAAESLLHGGHRVVLHARSTDRAAGIGGLALRAAVAPRGSPSAVAPVDSQLQHHSDKSEFRSDLNKLKGCELSECLLRPQQKFEDFQAEYEGSIPFTRSIKISYKKQSLAGFPRRGSRLVFRFPYNVRTTKHESCAWVSESFCDEWLETSIRILESANVFRCGMPAKFAAPLLHGGTVETSSANN
ncbi:MULTISPECIES: hypothetical protein [Bradyrhizobium]|uniref:hypothetical protein n=1 Tax=Bradyrhizobium TaxID=374 RepID=UPI000A02A2CF|nr:MULTISPECIES: hypothetical protein [Bradyrhizobium]UFW46423.1 hypothetical protein BaraCB756_29500 [Bradyrhizobium arachidis]